MVEVRYQVIDYKHGKTGKLEILRDSTKLPYAVALSIGDKKRVNVGDIFVRHGSQVERPTTDELSALQQEGDKAREA